MPRHSSSVLYGALQFASRGSVSEALGQGAIFGALLGAAASIRMWRSWPGAKELPSTDRVAVARVVRCGETVDEARLALAVLAHASAVRERAQRDRGQRWVLWVFAGLTVLGAIGETAFGRERQVFVWWGLVVFWAGLMAWLPTRNAQLIARATHAETAAQCVWDNGQGTGAG